MALRLVSHNSQQQTNQILTCEKDNYKNDHPYAFDETLINVKNKKINI